MTGDTRVYAEAAATLGDKIVCVGDKDEALKRYSTALRRETIGA